MTFQKIHIIINPAAGQDEAILNTLNSVFQKYEQSWQVSITNKDGDAERLTKEAVAAGADLVAGYGGDGTLMEVVNGLRDSDVPFGALPGGTANGLARDLGIPLDLAGAAELFCADSRVRQVDLGEVNGRYFLLHSYIGLLPEQQAARETKDKLGMLAYLGPVLRVIKDPAQSRFSLTIDGETFEQEAVICVVINTLGWGIDLPLKEPINFEDGLLDVLLINKDMAAAIESFVDLKVSGDIFQHWQGRQIAFQSEPEQDIWIDGEPREKTPFTAVVAPQALRVVVPA
jgi:YegS/Rv2252/BmrU family lipid kinase